MRIRQASRQGFTLTQLLVVFVIALLLFGLFFGAIVKTRIAAGRAQSQNNLKQLMLAAHSYHDTNTAFPPGCDDNHLSAAVYLLPYIEQDPLYKLTDFKKSVDDPANAKVRKTMVRVFLSPNDPLMNVNEYGATNYLFNAGTRAPLKDNDGVFFLNSKSKITTITDGTSNTIFVAETLKGDGNKRATDVRRQHVGYKAAALAGLKEKAGVDDFKEGKNVAADRCASWMDGRFLQGTFNSGRRPDDPRPDVSCAGEGGWAGPRTPGNQGVLVGLGDGSVRFVNVKISTETWNAAMTPAGGEVLGNDW